MESTFRRKNKLAAQFTSPDTETESTTSSNVSDDETRPTSPQQNHSTVGRVYCFRTHGVLTSLNALGSSSVWKEKSTHFDVWCREALDLVVNSGNTFVLEVFSFDQYVLQVECSAFDTSLAVNTEPWCIETGKCVSSQTVRQHSNTYDWRVDHVMNQSNSKFSPSRLVEFILENCDDVPAIVSTNYATLLGRTTMRNFIGHIVFKDLLPGVQTCQHGDCERMASAVLVKKKNFVPLLLFCSRHSRGVAYKKTRVMLYNPLLVALTARQKDVELSAMNIAEVFGARSRACGGIAQRAQLPANWWSLATIQQPKYLDQTDVINETASNMLPCAEHHLLQSVHNVGVHGRHSVAKCLLDLFVSRPEKRRHCDHR